MSRSTAFACALVVLTAARGVANESLTATAPAAPDLVQAALQASLAGDVPQRDKLLTQALAADDAYAPAQWQSGRVRFQGHWRTLEEVSELVAADRQRSEYDALKQSLTGTPADHEQLARFCYRAGLENEERYHWRNVLQANPRHEMARTRLDAREYRGGLYTTVQIANLERQQSSAAADFKKFKPQFDALVARAIDASAEESARQAALDEIRRVVDPRASPALEQAIDAHAADLSDSQVTELYQAFVAALEQIPDHAATKRLLNYSVFAAAPEIRHAAARALKPRPVTDYVPPLLGALQAPVIANIQTSASANGVVSLAIQLYQAGPLADTKSAHRVRSKVVQSGGARGPNGGPGPNTRKRIAQERYAVKLRAAETQRRVQQHNLQIEARNERIRETLNIALNLDFGASPQTYWQQWTSYNELYLPEHPLVSLADTTSDYQVETCSCFAPGTPVWTQAGATPIEQITVGDMVLAQNPTTGELAFRPVVGTTIRPPSKMARIHVGDEAIDTTLGHRFWVNGQGWRMAKELPDKSQFHSLAGNAELAAVAPLDPRDSTEAYNLVVDDFHTYFVGYSRLLVHDNTCPQPTTALIPGGERTPRPASPGVLGNVAP